MGFLWVGWGLCVHTLPECVACAFVSWVGTHCDALCSGRGLAGASMAHYDGFGQTRQRTFSQRIIALRWGLGSGGVGQAWQWSMGQALVPYSLLYVVTLGGPWEDGMEWGDQSPHRALPCSGRKRVVEASVSLPHPGVEWRLEGRGWGIRRPNHNITIITRIAVQDCTARSKWQG